MMQMTYKHSAIYSGVVGIFLLFAGCAKQSVEKKPTEMTFSELEEGAMRALESHEPLKATSYLTTLVEEHADSARTPEHRLRLADLHFAYGRENIEEPEALKMAYECYKKFYKLNPSDPKAEYASYRAILSRFYQTTRYECDSTLIEKTIKSCNKHLANERFVRGDHANDVRDVRYTCQRSLVDKELYIFNTYLRDGKIKSARNRLNYVRDTYVEVIPDLEARLLYLESKLAFEEDKPEIASRNVKKLVSEFQDSEYTVLAQNFVSYKKKFFAPAEFDWV